LRLADFAGVARSQLGSALIFALNGFVNLSAMHRNIARGFDTEADFVATDIDNGEYNVVADDDALIAMT